MHRFYEKSLTFREELIEFRRMLHQHPEIGMETHNTQKAIMEKLEELGVEHRKCAQTGVVALLGKKTGKTVLVRGDIDALPIQEENDLPFKSKIDGRGHLCGHDLHTTIALAVTKILKEYEDELEGQVKIMFQPGEEIGQGAKAMVEDGILEDPKPDVAFAVHMEPFMEAGKIGYYPGYATASMDTYLVKVTGKGGHSSTPHLANDPLVIVNSIYNQFMRIQAKSVNPFDPVALVTGKMGGGTAPNIIPDTAVIETGVRCFNEETRARMMKEMEDVIESTVTLHGATYEMGEIHTGSVYNDPALCKEIAPYLVDVLGKENVEEQEEPFTATEDFSYISSAVPSVFMWSGARNPDSDEVFFVHNPHVIFNEEAIFYSSSALANVAFEWLKNNK